MRETSVFDSKTYIYLYLAPCTLKTMSLEIYLYELFQCQLIIMSDCFITSNIYEAAGIPKLFTWIVKKMKVKYAMIVYW